MTKMLQKAFAEAAKLPKRDQDSFAAWMLEELATEARWDAAFARSQVALARMADEALAEHRSGKTLPLDPEKL